MTREELLSSGPERISPPAQADGTPSFGIARAHRPRPGGRRAVLRVDTLRCPRPGDSLRGALGAAALLVEPPDPRQHHGHHERKRAEFLAMGERRVFERITGNAELARHPGGDRGNGRTGHARRRLQRQPLRRHGQRAAPGRRPSPAAALPACAGGRRGRPAQRIVRRRRVPAAAGGRRRDRPRCALEELRAPALAAGLRAAGPPRSGPPMGASSARWRSTSTSRAARCPRLRTDGPAHRAGGYRHRAGTAEDALRASEARFRTLFENVVEGVYRRRRRSASNRRIPRWSTCSATTASKSCSRFPPRSTCT